MDNNNFEKMTPFDQLISTQSLQILKLLIPYVPPENQRMLAVYTQFLELQHVINFFENFHNEIYSQDFEQETFSLFNIIHEIRPYLPEQISETLDMIMNIMEISQAMNETADSDGNADSAFDPMSMMKNMFNPEQQSIFDMYNETSSQKRESNTEKGEIDND